MDYHWYLNFEFNLLTVLKQFYTDLYFVFKYTFLILNLLKLLNFFNFYIDFTYKLDIEIMFYDIDIYLIVIYFFIIKCTYLL